LGAPHKPFFDKGNFIDTVGVGDLRLSDVEETSPFYNHDSAAYEKIIAPTKPVDAVSSASEAADCPPGGRS
jgi:hypothetical protein